MNRQLFAAAKALGSAKIAESPGSGTDEVVIPSATARAIIARARRSQQQHTGKAIERQRAALESLPHIVNALTAIWGYHECSNYLRKLLVIDTARDNRQGFSREAFEELAFLYRLVQENRSSLVQEVMPKAQRDELTHRERLMQIESAYLRRS